MVLISTMIHVLVFALCAGAVISVLVLVPTFLYTIPYTLWVGAQQTKGKHKDKLQKGQSIFRAAKDATKLYKAWISKSEPTF
jgi:hypothetical protein